MRKSLVIICLTAVGVLLTVSQASATARHAAAVKTVTVAMHDPGCHWFATGGKFSKSLAVKGPVALVNFDEAALKVVGPVGVRRVAVGKKAVFTRGTYRITMVGQAPDDNTLKLTVR